MLARFMKRSRNSREMADEVKRMEIKVVRARKHAIFAGLFWGLRSVRQLRHAA